MKAKWIAPMAALGALALTAGACGSRDATGPNITLSLEEVGTLATELSAVMSASVLMRGPAPPAQPLSLAWARAVVAVTPFNSSWNCPAGGTASIASTFDTTSSPTSASFSGDATLSYSSCKTAHYTTSGSFHANGFEAITQTHDTLQLAASGSLKVTALDGRSGVCPIDVTANGGASGTAKPVYVVSGYACGVKLTGTY